MIGKLKPYPAYRESSISYLEEVPSHWEVRRLKHVFKRIVGGATPSSTQEEYWDGDVVWVTPSDVSKTSRLRTSGRRITEEGLRACSAEVVPKGSLVLTSRAPVGNVALAEVDLCTNQGCKALVVRADVIDSQFAFAALCCLEEEFQRRAAGTTFVEISMSQVADVPMVLPPLHEQHAIVRYLDYVDRRIRRYIRAKQKMITLLNEQMQAVIHRAVTRGLDPNVRLKPSGIQWLADVPEHWEILSISALSTTIQTGPFGSQLPASSYIAGGVPVINPSHIIDGRLVPELDISVSVTTAERLARHILQAGDLVLARRGELGRCAMVGEHEKGWLCGTGSLRVRLRPSQMLAPFAALLLRDVRVRESLRASSLGSTMDNLNEGLVGRLRLPVPPVEEQQLITGWVDAQGGAIERAVKVIRRGMRGLEEFRSSLIANVVTGKLDVREAVAALPAQEAAADEPLEEIAARDIEDDAADLDSAEEVEA